MFEGASRNRKIWTVAGIAGLVVALVILIGSIAGFFGAVFAGIVAAIVVALLLMLLWPDSEPEAVEAWGGSASTPSEAAQQPTTAPQSTAAPVAAEPAPVENAAAGPEPDSVKPALEETNAGAATGDYGSVKASAALAGQSELSQRKGSWRYDGGDRPAAVAPEPEPVAPARKTSAKVDALAAAGNAKFDDDADMSGSVDPIGGTRPKALDGPRNGKADDLKQIKGVGPKMEKTCNALGFFHFDQIANWTADEVAWVDQNLEGFKGRVTRDSWVEQAKILAEGGSTEFSKKVHEGGVY